MVECQLPKLDVAGSSPVARSLELPPPLRLRSGGGLRFAVREVPEMLPVVPVDIGVEPHAAIRADHGGSCNTAGWVAASAGGPAGWRYRTSPLRSSAGSIRADRAAPTWPAPGPAPTGRRTIDIRDTWRAAILTALQVSSIAPQARTQREAFATAGP